MRDKVAFGQGSWVNEGDAKRIGKWKDQVESMWIKRRRLYSVREGGKCVGVEDDK